ncbi:MAG: alpha/beta hydrolase [Mycobacteriaceae bacterium]|nr:alpha/beta hydrolase [Mycobacteriaceae bacterium]
MSFGPRPRVVDAEGVPMSALVAEVAQPRAVIVALPGEGATAAYFDCPSYPSLSLLRLGATVGFTVIALDRPGYGSSAPYPHAHACPEQRVRLGYAAVDRILGERPQGAGIFLMAHSHGCELALRMAAHHRGANLIGMELAGGGMHYQPDLAIEKIGPTAHLYPPEAQPEISHAAYEQEIASDWSRREFPALAAQVRIPVQFSVAEFENVWQCDPLALAKITAAFSASPHITTNYQPGAGHNLSLSYTAAAYHLKVLSFVEQCVVAREIPAPLLT